MTELNMIDTMGYGIYEMYVGQARRYFPMPDYDLSEADAVRMLIYGRIVDPAYTRLLIQKTDLSLPEIFALDCIQKHLPVDEDMVKKLKRMKLIEGRKPNYHVSSSIATVTATKADYIHMRAQDDAFYTKLVMDYMAEFGAASRKEIDNLLWSKLSDALDDEQKGNKIGNLLTNLRAANKIKNRGTRKIPEWVLIEKE